jgi:hypothetical protein
MDSLRNILGTKDYDEPPEVAKIKQYVKDEFQADVSVQVRERDIIIAVPNAALANTLKLRGPELKRICQTDKRLSFRIG